MKYLYEKYYPITATPFRHGDAYMELAPCDALKPYIRCFWGTRVPIQKSRADVSVLDVITPDTCADVIFQVNYTKNRIESSFCGIDDKAFISQADAEEGIVSVFAVRFYAWSAVLFSEESMQGTKNGFFDAGEHFEGLKRAMEPKLFVVSGIEQRAFLAEEYLLRNFSDSRENPLFMKAIWQIIEQRGDLKALELAKELHISDRQLERIFLQNMGITPKKAASLIRYQSLWQEVCRQPAFQIQDAVWRYGYTDQAHLLNDFKRFHGMSLRDARRHAAESNAFLYL